MSANAVGYVWESSPYEGVALIVHLAIADSVNDQHDYELWASGQSIADKSRVSRTNVYRILQRMVAEGYLEVLESNRKAGKPSRYRFTFKGVSPERTPPVSRDRTPGCDERRQGVSPETTQTQKNPNSSSQVSSSTHVSGGLGDDERVSEILKTVAEAKLRRASNVTQPQAWLAKVQRNDRLELGAECRRLLDEFPTAPVTMLAAALLGEKSPHLAHHRRAG